MSVLKNPDPYKRTGSARSGPKRVSGQSESEKIYGVPSSHGVQKAGSGNTGTTMNAGNQQLMDAYGAGNPVIAGGGTSGTQTSTTPTVGSSKAPTHTTTEGTTMNTGNQQLLEAYGREETPSAAKVAYDTGMTELQRTYGLGVKKQEQIRSDSRREASIAYDRMSKYLPRAQMAMGTAGTGMAESDRIAAYNHYTGRLADANRVYADKVAELDEARAAGETKLQRVYAEQQETERKEKDTQTLDVYKGMMDDALASGGRLTQAEYDAIVEKGKSMGLSDSAIESMVLLNEMYGGKITPDGELTEEEKKEQDNLTLDVYKSMAENALSDGKLTQAEYDEMGAYVANSGVSGSVADTLAKLQAMYGGRVTKDGELTEAEKADYSKMLADDFVTKYETMTGLGAKKLTTEQYQSLVKYYEDNKSEMNAADVKFVEKQLAIAYENIMTPEEQAKADAQAQIEKDGGAVRNDVVLDGEMPGGWGDNLTVSDKSGNKYSVQIADKSTDAAVLSIASKNVSDGEVFRYGGELYLSANGTAYRLERRTWDNFKGEGNTDYDKLMTIFKNIEQGRPVQGKTDA